MQSFAKSHATISVPYIGYIAGIDDGILTVGGVAAARRMYLFNAVTMAIESINHSLDSGHYLIMNLDASKTYLVLAVDSRKEYEPFAWDAVSPSTNLTLIEQQALWQSFQT